MAINVRIVSKNGARPGFYFRFILKTGPGPINFLNSTNDFSVAFFLIDARLPLKRNFSQIVLFLSETAINTVPTGLPCLPPVGPAIPVIPMPKQLFASIRTLRAIAKAISSETAPFPAISSAGICRIFSFVLLL